MADTTTPKPQPPMRLCFNCGEELGRYRDYDPLDTCGKSECNREAADAERQRRNDAHDDLDDRIGWSSRF